MTTKEAILEALYIACHDVETDIEFGELVDEDKANCEKYLESWKKLIEYYEAQ